MVGLLLKVILGLIVLTIAWAIYCLNTLSGDERNTSRRRDYFYVFVVPGFVGVVVLLLTKHLVAALLFAGPSWIFALLMLAEELDRLEWRREKEGRWVPKHLGLATVGLILLLVAVVAVFAGKTELQLEIGLVSLFWGAVIGACTGGLMMVGALSGFNYGLLLATIAGTVHWLVPGFGGTRWFDNSAQELWPGQFSSTPRGFYVTSFLLACVFTAILVNRTLPKMKISKRK